MKKLLKLNLETLKTLAQNESAKAAGGGNSIGVVSYRASLPPLG